jgi:hypothetical protein
VIKPQPERKPWFDLYGDNGGKWCGVFYNPIKHQPYKKDNLLYVRESMAIDQEGEWVYIADEPDYRGWGYKGVPSIHVPKSMSRIFLRVKDVRAERLQEITNEDAQAEGMDDIPNCARGYLANFMLLWDDLNAKRGFPWKDNPWVWVYEFERTEVTDNA